MNLPIIKASAEDVDAIVDIFRAVSAQMTRHGIDQWDDHYPTKNDVVKDQLRSELFVIKQDQMPIATVCLNTIQDPQYRTVHWRCRDIEVLVIHRLAVHPDYQGQGLAKQMVQFAINFAKENNKNSIRLDAYADNDISNTLYQKMGFQKANGYCYFRKKPIPFYCWEYFIGIER